MISARPVRYCALLLLGAILTAPGAGGQEPRPTLLWELSTGLDLPLATQEDSRPHRDVVYVTIKGRGLAVLDVSDPGHPRQVAVVGHDALGGLEAMHLTQRGDHLFLALGDFFNAQGAEAGLAVVDVREPRTPEVLSVWTSQGRVRGSSHVLVDGDHAYLAAMSEGVFVFDVSDPTRIRRITSFQPDIHFPRPNPNRIRHPNARGLALDGDRLLVAYDAGGLRILDVSQPSRPREIGRYVNTAVPGNKQQAYNHVVVDGRWAYVTVDYCGLEILDVGDPTNVHQVGWWNPWSCQTPANLWFNSPGHTNQLVYDAGGRLVVLSAGDSELQVVDVSDRRRPRRVARFGRPNNQRGVWGASWGHDAVYLTYIRAVIPFRSTWSGLKAVTPPTKRGDPTPSRWPRHDLEGPEAAPSPPVP